MFAALRWQCVYGAGAIWGAMNMDLGRNLTGPSWTRVDVASPLGTVGSLKSSPEFAQDHKTSLRSDRGPIVLFDFSKLRF
jgi:hypothetical protein